MKESPLLDLFFGVWKDELVRFVSEGGDKTCDDCKKNNGKVFNINDTQMPWLPIHPHCRCQYALASNPLKFVSTSQLQKYRIKTRLKEKYHLKDVEAEDLASQITAAREENPIIREQQRFLLFNGQYLLSSDGEFLAEAASGKPVSSSLLSVNVIDNNLVEEKYEWVFDYSYYRQGLSKIGGIPIGVYSIKASEGRRPEKSVLSHVMGVASWGVHSWSLHPDDTTNTRERKNFFIHGGNKFGSAGCIDVQYKDIDFRKYFTETGLKTFFVLVRYTKEKVTIRGTTEIHDLKTDFQRDIFPL